MQSPTVRQAAVLAGGLGTRLGELAASTPKPLLSCGDRPFLAWLLRELTRFGVEEVVLLTGHLADVVEAMLPAITGSLPKPLHIICNREERSAGTGGALFHARNHLTDRFLLCNGDSWLDFNLGRLLAESARDPEETIGRLVLRRLDDAGRYGVVEMDGDRITAFRAGTGPGKPGTINAGVYIFHRRILDEVVPVCSLERDILPALASRGALRGIVTDGYFVDIGLPADLQRAQTELPARLRRRALFLGDDGIINVQQGRNGIAEPCSFVPGALTAIRAASDAGWHVFVLTNHSGRAGCRDREPQFAAFSIRVTDAIRAAGGTIDELTDRPIGPEAQVDLAKRVRSRRNPAPGTLLDLLARWQLNPSRCLLIGGRPGDLAAAAAAGVPARRFPDCGDLAEFAAPLLGRG